MISSFLSFPPSLPVQTHPICTSHRALILSSQSPTLLKTPSRDYLAFYVTVYIPAGRIEEFGVDVHNMAIKTAALDKIEFGAFDASSKNGHVEAKVSSE